MTTTDPKLIEPVAWIIENKGRSEKLLSEKPLPRGADELGWTETPLYTAAAINEAAQNERAGKILADFVRMIESGEMFLCDLPEETLAGLRRHFAPPAIEAKESQHGE